jgi:hypothetical protein
MRWSEAVQVVRTADGVPFHGFVKGEAFCGGRGWLSSEHPFTAGSVPDQFLTTLHQHIKEAWQPVAAAGWHECELCKTDPAEDGSNLWIPAPTTLYIAPAMISHYIEVHSYCPPDEFINAVLSCPAQGTPQFEKAMLPFMSLYPYAG